jgi:hypothetical protein
LIKFQKKEFYIRIKFFFFIFLIKKLNSKKEKKIKKNEKTQAASKFNFFSSYNIITKKWNFLVFRKIYKNEFQR